jgi:hypothetical protein
MSSPKLRMITVFVINIKLNLLCWCHHVQWLASLRFLTNLHGYIFYLSVWNILQIVGNCNCKLFILILRQSMNFPCVFIHVYLWFIYTDIRQLCFQRCQIFLWSFSPCIVERLAEDGCSTAVSSSRLKWHSYEWSGVLPVHIQL